MLQLIFNTDFFFSVLRITAPILFATLGAVVGEKAGVSNIGLEGTMMVAALFGSLTTYWSGSWAVGLVVALFCGVLVSLLMGFFAFNLKTDIILTGIAVNMIGSGGTLFLVKVITQQTEGKALASTTSLITAAHQIPSWNIPMVKAIFRDFLIQNGFIHMPPLILTAKLSIERPIAINRMVIKLIVQKLFCKDRK